MNVAEFMKAMSTVEQDHQLVLTRIATLKQSVECLLSPDQKDIRHVLRRLKEVNDYLGENLRSHMLREETELFPLIEQLGLEGPGLVERLREDHEEILQKQDEFASSLAIALEIEDILPKMVRRDLLIDGWALWDLLSKHAFAETQAVEQCLTRHLGEELAATRL
jgi:DUF438 domain-containing protein